MVEITKQDVMAMKEAIQMSAASLACADVPMGGPFGAVIYKGGKKIAEGFNHVLANNDPSAHGEVYTIRLACQALGTWDLSDCSLYTSCEPCPMCLMTAKWANIQNIYFAATREDAARIGFKDDDLYQMLKDGVYATPIAECRDEAVNVMTKWHEKFAQKGQY